MKVKKVNRYTCEFCGKSGCSASHISRHEKHCTMNPDRICGMCKASEDKQPKMSKLLVILPDPQSYVNPNLDYIVYDGLGVAVEKVLLNLRDVAHNCPACILAALRQKGIPIPLVDDFNFRDECRAFWDDINSRDIDI